jgi:hypothetical protein
MTFIDHVEKKELRLYQENNGYAIKIKRESVLQN